METNRKRRGLRYKLRMERRKRRLRIAKYIVFTAAVLSILLLEDATSSSAIRAQNVVEASPTEIVEMLETEFETEDTETEDEVLTTSEQIGDLFGTSMELPLKEEESLNEEDTPITDIVEMHLHDEQQEDSEIDSEDEDVEEIDESIESDNKDSENTENEIIEEGPTITDLPEIITTQWAIENDYMGDGSQKIYNLNACHAFTTSRLNVRAEPNTDSEILGVLDWFQEVYYDTYQYDEEWGVVDYDGQFGFVYLGFIDEDGPNYNYKEAWGDKRKSYEGYTAITKTSSPHYQISRNLATTNERGFRMYKGRYLVAVGSYYTTNIGQVFDAVLANGVEIPCVLGDCKANQHTLDGHSRGLDGGVVEFIVDPGIIRQYTNTGDCSYVNDGWNSPVVGIKLYDYDLY